MSVPEHASDSTEAFDKICETCEARDEVEAVRFCRHCRQYVCLKCAESHVRANSSRHHMVMNKTDLEALKPSRSLFERQVAPLTTITLELQKCYECGSKYIQDHYCLERATIIGLYSTKGSSELLLALEHNSLKSIIVSKATFHSTINYSTISLDYSTGVRISSQYCVDAKTQNLYITLPIEKQVHVLSNNLGTKKPAFRTYGECHGIATFDSGLAVSININSHCKDIPNWQVHFVDYNGNVKSRVLYDKQGKALFGEPRYLASNVSETLLFVCDVTAKAVMAIDVLGTPLFVFKEPNCTSLRGISVDNEDRLYVACETSQKQNSLSSNILQISKDGKQRRSLMSNNSLPTNVWFDRSNNLLAVLVDDKNATVYMFLP